MNEKKYPAGVSKGLNDKCPLSVEPYGISNQCIIVTQAVSDEVMVNKPRYVKPLQNEVIYIYVNPYNISGIVTHR